MGAIDNIRAFTQTLLTKLYGIEEGAQVNINPSRLCSYLPVAGPFTTPTLVANTPTKIVPNSTIKTKKDFILDVPNTRYFLDDVTAVGRWFTINASTSMASNSSNHLVTLELYINGVFEDGVGLSRWIAAGMDTGALGLSGTFQLSDQDYIEIYVTNTVGGTVTFSRLSINIVEMAGAE